MAAIFTERARKVVFYAQEEDGSQHGALESIGFVYDEMVNAMQELRDEEA